LHGSNIANISVVVVVIERIVVVISVITKEGGAVIRYNGIEYMVIRYMLFS